MSRKQPIDLRYRFPIDLILKEFIDDSRGSKKKDPTWHSIEFENCQFIARLNSLRYFCFRRTGTACVCCRRQATCFLFQEDRNNPGHGHFNLYALVNGRKPLLFTKDHIVPRYYGGTDDQSNLRTMCQPCNSKRGHTILDLEELRVVCGVSNRV